MLACIESLNLFSMLNKSFSNATSLSDVSWLPFNNFMHYVRHKNVDLSCILGSESDRLIHHLGGNCIYKSVLAESVLKSVVDSVHAVVSILGTHHAIIYCIENDLFFYDSCLFMSGGLKIDVDFACEETVLAPFADKPNYVALERESGSVFYSIWALDFPPISNTWCVCYDLQDVNDIPQCDWFIERFKQAPDVLMFRYFNSVSRRLEQLSLCLLSKDCLLYTSPSPRD